ncbi:CpaF family protein [Candidatus Woesearchaeota archaeon]|nr:CpaF family protein [Candidatus Woesearchaeota archaeon]
MERTREQYKVNADEVEVDVKITQTEGGRLAYELTMPDCSPATEAFLEEIKHQLIMAVQVTSAEILDPKIIQALKDKFKHKAETLISEQMPQIKTKVRNFLIGRLLHEMVGLGNIEYLLNDVNLEEVVINSAEEPISVFHKRYGWLITNVTVPSEETIQNYSNIIARRVGRQITTLNPLLDAHLVTGDRANTVLYPISTKGHTITIRKFARDPWTVVDFIANNTCSAEIFSLIWLAMQYEMNVLVSGGTASGKTSLLNVIMPFIPPNQRILSIEDTREIQLPKFLYWCPLTTRQPNPEGKGEITMLDLLVNALRMRPDRIILGEIRHGRDAEVLFEAMHTGHSVYATVHADSINATIERLTNPPINVPPNQLSAVNLTVTMFRDRRRGIRRVYQLGEFITTQENEKAIVKPNILYRWKPETDKIVPHSESLRIFEDLNMHTGLSQKEIAQELVTKQKILKWMVKNNLRQLDQVGNVISDYYLDQESLLKKIK